MELEIRQFSTSDADFEQKMHELLERGSEFDPEIDAAVAGIIKDVRERGDQALLEYTHEFDRNSAETVADLEVNADELEAACGKISPVTFKALNEAIWRITDYHEIQAEDDFSWQFKDEDGSEFGQLTSAIDRVGIYVPGGLAAYPSSVLMTAIPATIAGVAEIVMVVPAPDGKVNDAVLAAAYLTEVDRVIKIGGAQAIAALAYGTETVPKVDKIVGPGNAWVSAAKRQVFGRVGIDMIAGPSEVVVACDTSTKADWAAMDMFAQAEHDESAQSVLISASRKKMDEVRSVMETMLPKMTRKHIIARSLAQNGAMIHVRSRKELAAVINRIAPEHLGLMVSRPMEVFAEVMHAGAVFLGPHSTEVFGDYCAGPNHVLPTSGAAKFSSPLGVHDFWKRTSFVQCTPKTAAELAVIAGHLATEEGLSAHADAAKCRIPKKRTQKRK